MKNVQNILYPFKKAEMLIDYNLPDVPSDVTLILGPGKYNDMYLPLYNYLADLLPKENVNFVRFNSPFIESQNRRSYKKKCIKTYDVLLEDIKAELPNTKFYFMGGKSLSAQIVSRMNPESATAYIFLTYPLHLPFLRIPFSRKHLFNIKKPMMFVSGTEDKYADRGLLELLMGALNPHAHLMMIPNTGHSLELLNEEKRSQDDLNKEIGDILLWFMSDVIEKKIKK